MTRTTRTRRGHRSGVPAPGGGNSPGRPGGRAHAPRNAPATTAEAPVNPAAIAIEVRRVEVIVNRERAPERKSERAVISPIHWNECVHVEVRIPVPAAVSPVHTGIRDRFGGRYVGHRDVLGTAASPAI